MQRLLFLGILLGWTTVQGQVAQKLATAMDAFNADAQLKYALSSLYVVDAATGDIVYDQNSKVGMATASTEKIVTAATAFDVLGAGYRYETRFGIVKTPGGKSLYIEPSGDPSLASWRWPETKDSAFLARLKAALQAEGIRELRNVVIYTGKWGDETIPEGWIWQDLGNYYGAGAQALNWRENQFDLVLKSGAALGSAVSVVKTVPYLYDYRITSLATAAEKNSGDNSTLFYPSMGRQTGVLRGTIPAGQNGFVVSGSIYDPANQFVKTVINSLKSTVRFSGNVVTTTNKEAKEVHWFYTNSSPELSKIIYWFLRKSINLYGEALLRTVGLNRKGMATTDNGIAAVQEHWKTRGVDVDELHLYDGSGLSPQNRITTRAQVAILKYAREQSWFADYYEGFPLYNDMKMKSGTINRVKGFSGYQKSKDGKDYIFSFLVNNYNGSQLALVRKMYKVLDELK
ncbi:D-alanyl-D-alanine carboxypeptidase/D-alanyl-D-alanine-endopeptidase [Niabella sp. CC-SYL272]|uniref:D-alanyl-D-alanine carboxypeptidase/D-alanyl-D-alanine endopeptidase n=1 Tax=Niabella agricola TaxID=2891571 RepID=UPI001F20D933|nr:D-alanyl-D-alanine carboxypeptidase/D-alanyl-D-alanine-endopeptidase [Niabella agricola]MCF3109331.1 D-alanyl-D-alanine carboxypeptidase/D-alanyl-D-alanine-endopeptidase [Niabella agricola]